MLDVRCLLMDANLKHSFWGKALATASYLSNISPHCSIGMQITNELFTGEKIDLSNLYIFGSKVWPYIPKIQRNKLEDKRNLCLFLG